MNRRQTEGAETWRRLRDRDRGQAAAERLSSQILRIEGYSFIDPSHPLGGPDGLKDVICVRGGEKWIGAAHFPRGQQDFKVTLSKFKNDLAGVSKNNAEGIAFVTNQELSLGEREKLIANAESLKVDLFHIERISSILDQPVCYGTRLEYLDIEMTKEEQLAFMSAIQQGFEDLRTEREMMLSLINTSDALTRELKEMRAARIASDTPKESFDVSPVYFYQFPFNREKRAHRCSICGYGYFVKGSSLNLVLAGFAPTCGASCPKCGNVDEISSY